MNDKIKPDDKSLAHNPFAKLANLSAPSSPAPAPAPAPARPPPVRFADKVVVRKEKKGHGGKTVTVISGVLANFRDEIAGALKKALGTGARIEEGDVILQGDVVDRVIATLEKEGAKKIVKGSG